MNDNADTIETAELDKVVADVLNYDNMMNVDMYIDECLKEININQLQSNELDLVKILEEQNESSISVNCQGMRFILYALFYM